jgi:hypothetical protein
LGETARLESRRHQERVAAGLDLMRERVVELDDDAKFFRISSLRGGEEFLLFRDRRSRA